MKITTTRKEFNNKSFYLISFNTDAKSALFNVDNLKTKLTYDDLQKITINDITFSKYMGELCCLDYSPYSDKLKYWAIKFIEEIFAMDLEIVNNEIKERNNSDEE